MKMTQLLQLIAFQVNGKQYMLREDTQQVYDYESVMQARKIPGFAPILLGKMVKRSNGDLEIVKERL